VLNKTAPNAGEKNKFLLNYVNLYVFVGPDLAIMLTSCLSKTSFPVDVVASSFVCDSLWQQILVQKLFGSCVFDAGSLNLF